MQHDNNDGYAIFDHLLTAVDLSDVVGVNDQLRLLILILSELK